MEYRYKQLNFRVTDSEYEIIQKKMKLSGIKKPTAYLRKMAMDGYVIRLDLSELTEILRLARINSNNLNQVAKRANETGNICEWCGEHTTDCRNWSRWKALWRNNGRNKRIDYYRWYSE